MMLYGGVQLNEGKVVSFTKQLLDLIKSLKSPGHHFPEAAPVVQMIISGIKKYTVLMVTRKFKPTILDLYYLLLTILSEHEVLIHFYLHSILFFKEIFI